MSKDNQGAIFIASFAEQLIREKVMRDEPDLVPEYTEHDLMLNQDNLVEYEAYIKSLRTFPYPVKEEQDGKELREGKDFKLVCSICEEGFFFIEDHVANYVAIPNSAIPIEPDTPLQPVKESAMGWLKKEGYPDVMPMTLDNLGIILDRYTKYLSSPPEPSSKEQEGDAVGFAEWIGKEDLKLYKEGWCQPGGSNGFHYTTEQLYQLYTKNKNL